MKPIDKLIKDSYLIRKMVLISNNLSYYTNSEMVDFLVFIELKKELLDEILKPNSKEIYKFIYNNLYKQEFNLDSDLILNQEKNGFDLFGLIYLFKEVNFNFKLKVKENVLKYITEKNLSWAECFKLSNHHDYFSNPEMLAINIFNNSDDLKVKYNQLYLSFLTLENFEFFLNYQTTEDDEYLPDLFKPIYLDFFNSLDYDNFTNVINFLKSRWNIKLIWWIQRNIPNKKVKISKLKELVYRFLSS